MRSTRFTLLILLLAGGIPACQRELDLGTLPQQPPTRLDTSYVQLFPSFSGYEGAEDVHVGNDQLLYVADTRANRLVMLNRAGQLLSQRTMLHPLSVGQDSRLDLLVGGEVVAVNGDTIGAVFRVHLVSTNPDSAHRLEVSRIDTVWKEPAKPVRRFPGITVFADNSYLVVRTGPDNSSFIDPDARILLFDASDHFITPVPGFTSTSGGGITNLNHPTAIASFPGVKDFVVTQTSEGVSYGAIWMTYESTADFEGWLPKYDPASPDDRSVAFIRPSRFLDPEGVAIDPVRRDVFIADAALDSVFKFNSRGAFKAESFGFAATDGAMQRPTGVAFFSSVLYVLDAESGQILRFRLSTDIPR
jgi:hypothetical protein